MGKIKPNKFSSTAEIKSILLEILEIYSEDLRFEFEFKEVKEIKNKIQDLLNQLRYSEINLEDSKFLLNETRKILTEYEKEKVKKMSFMNIDSMQQWDL